MPISRLTSARAAGSSSLKALTAGKNALGSITLF